MTLIKSYSEGICYLELNRPKVKNAINKKMVEELIEFLHNSADSGQFRVLVISGKNGFFSSGADLEWMQNASSQPYQENMADASLFNDLYYELNSFPKPIIVKIEKGAYGGAIGIAACADIVITSPDSTFAFSEVKLGLVPATVAPYIIKKTGLANARALLLSGNEFSGQDAFHFNLVQYLYPANQIGIKTRELAKKMSANSPAATKQTKILLNRLGDSVVSVDKELQDFCAGLISSARESFDGQEGVKAFFEKRKPKWNDQKK